MSSPNKAECFLLAGTIETNSFPFCPFVIKYRELETFKTCTVLILTAFYYK